MDLISGTLRKIFAVDGVVAKPIFGIVDRNKNAPNLCTLKYDAKGGRTSPLADIILFILFSIAGHGGKRILLDAAPSWQ